MSELDLYQQLISGDVPPLPECEDDEEDNVSEDSDEWWDDRWGDKDEEDEQTNLYCSCGNFNDGDGRLCSDCSESKWAEEEQEGFCSKCENLCYKFDILQNKESWKKWCLKEGITPCECEK